MLADIIEPPRPRAPPPPKSEPCAHCAKLEREVAQLRAACVNLQDALAAADRRSERGK